MCRALKNSEMETIFLFGVEWPNSKRWKFILSGDIVIWHTTCLFVGPDNYREESIEISREQFKKILEDLVSHGHAKIETSEGDKIFLTTIYDNLTQLFVRTASGDEFFDHDWGTIPSNVFTLFDVIPTISR